MRITNIAVKGLFGMFDHEIPLNQESRITIVNGPNGVGKTVLMRMVHGLFHYEYDYVDSITFEQLRIEDSNGGVLSVERALEEYKRASSKLLFRYQNEDQQLYDHYTLSIPNPLDLVKRVSELHPEYIAVYYGGSFYWVSGVDKRIEGNDQNPRDGDTLKRPSNVYSRTDMLAEFPDIYAEFFGEMPSWFKRYFYDENLFGWLLQGGYAKLISTERLKMDFTKKEIIDAAKLYYRASRDDLPFIFFPSTSLAVDNVEGFFDELSRLEYEALELESEIEKLEDILDDDTVKSSDIATELLESKLSELSFEYDMAFTYDQKKGELFSQLLNERLLFKSVQRGDENRYWIIAHDGSGLPLSLLSSGEQQLFVLYYHLLEKVETNTLVMIDEPELSMNVVWQRNFLKDLQRIIELCNFDVLIATHSPEVIYDKWDWTVALGEKASD
ncbi:MAG: AAA family ATPase [Chloroflexota bacterium]|nr:AAA family ATPase [Chloroflexota bacterium]